MKYYEIFTTGCHIYVTLKIKEEILRLIDEQENLTVEIAKSIENAVTLSELEDIYRPFRPKRRTRATIAKEKGLAPLAEIILAQNPSDNIESISLDFIDTEKDVESSEDAMAGAMDIIAEEISDNPEYRKDIRQKQSTLVFWFKSVNRRRQCIPSLLILPNQ